MTRFSQIYLTPPILAPDSPRMRNRLAAVMDIDRDEAPNLADLIRRRLGVSVRAKGYRCDFDEFFASADIRDVLDAVTVIFDFKNAMSDEPTRWLRAVANIFEEERVRYRVDGQGIVHFAVDQEFERNRTVTLAGLSQSRYSAVRIAFEEAFVALADVPTNGKLAIRCVFDANEIAFKLAFPNCLRLGGAELRQQLKPVIEARYNTDVATRKAVLKVLNSYCEWVDGMHWYRHGQGEEEPSQPPIEVAVVAIGLGSSFLRWLLDVLPSQAK